MWKEIKRLKHGESINVQDLKTNLYWEFGKFTSQDGESLESYYSRFYKMMNELIKNQYDVTNHHVNVQFLLQLQPEWQRKDSTYYKSTALVTQQQPVYHPQNHPTHYTQNSSTRLQQVATRNRGKVIVNSPQPIYDQEPSMVAEDDETLKDKEIDKLMDLISLSFKKIHKPTNNNLRTSSNTSRANQDNSPRINRSTGYENQRIGNVARAKETIADWRDNTDDESKDQELEAYYMYMAQLQEVSPDAVDSGPIFDDEPLQNVSNDDHYNVFAIKSEHLEQSESIDQNDDGADLANKRELLTSLIKKLKCEIDDSKNRNKFLKTSNKVLIKKLKGEIEDFKTKNKCLESSNNCFKEANNKLSETNKLLYNDFKKSQAELARRNDVEYALKVEIDCEKATGDLISYKMKSQKSFNKYTQTINNLNQTIPKMKKKLCAHQETISILSQQKEVQIKLYKTRKDKELDKVIALENKVKVLDDILYKTGQSVQTMNMLNNKCRTSFTKPEFLKKAQRANLRLPQLKSNLMEDRVMLNNSKGKKQEVEDHHRNVKFSKNKTSVTACNDSLNAKTLNVNFVCAICGKCVLNDKHDMCVLKYVAKPLRITVASESNQKPRNYTRKLYEHIKIVLFIIDSGCSKHKTRNLKLLFNFVEKFLGTVKFENDQIAPILGYGDMVQGAVNIKRVYYVEGINYNLFSVGQFCDADLEVAFQKSTCYIRDLKGNDLLTDHLCSSCELRKAKQKSFHTKITPSSKRRLQLLHMDLCGPMRVASINGKRYVLVIVDDYSRYTWTHFLRSKDETPKVLIDFLRLVQRGLHAQVRIVRTDKGAKFLNQTLHAYFAAEGIHHQTSVARTPEQNSIVERQNRTLVEAARTMLSAVKVPLFFWAEAIATTCFTQNRSLVIPRHEETPYHIINDQKPSVKFFHIFGSLCYIVRDGENLNKMKEKDELPQMASDHVSFDPEPECQRTELEHVSLSPDPPYKENVTQADRTVTISNELDLLFSPMFDELINGSSQEYAQKERIDFEESFAPVARVEAVSVGTPMATKHLDANLSGTPVDQMKYRSMVGALMYLTASRLDIMHATCYCARYQAKPTEKHLTAVKGSFGTSKIPFTWDSGIRKTPTKPVSSVNQPLFRLPMDLFGPTFVKILNKKSYCLVITDDYSRFTWVFFLATKDKTTPIFKTFLTGLENQLSLKNRVLVTKPHNKTHYELLHGRTPSIGFMRPFGCLVTILNTIDPLGKFQGKVDEGFLVGYSVCSKAFIVFNNRTRIIQETLHVQFLENKPNVAGTGPSWLFDINSLTRTMNYHPVHARNQTNFGVGFQDNFDAKKAGEEVDQSYMLFPVCNEVTTASSIVSTVGQNSFNSTNTFSAAGPSNTAVSPTYGKTSDIDTSQLPDDLDMLELEDLIYSDDEDVVGA
nr:hypothetical protein [Tanacetum cinerariifolium]